MATAIAAAYAAAPGLDRWNPSFFSVGTTTLSRHAVGWGRGASRSHCEWRGAVVVFNLVAFRATKPDGHLSQQCDVGMRQPTVDAHAPGM